MIAKRIFDFSTVLISFLFLSPVFLFISVLIKVFMPGPIFFIQERVGIKGTIFRLFKFRTMSLINSDKPINFEPGNKSRITRFGKILRKTKLDELPQLLNVIKGDMSLVGPRPEVKEWTLIYPELWEIVHSVKPGITDSASLIFRNEEEILANSSNPYETYKNEILPKKLELYLSYVKNRSFLSDILIIFKTLKVVVIK